MLLLFLSSRTVFSFFCTLPLASSPTMLPSTKSTSYRRLLRDSRSSWVRITFFWTPWNWLGHSPTNLLMKTLCNFDVSSSSRWVPCKWRTSARKRHKLSLYGCLVLSSYVKQLIVPFPSRSSDKTASLHPIGTSLRKRANTINFVNL